MKIIALFLLIVALARADISAPANLGQSVTFTVTVMNPSSVPLTYQWLKDGVAIAGATAFNYTIPAVVAGDAGRYSCRVFYAKPVSGTLTSDLGTLVVNLPPAITPSTASVSMVVTTPSSTPANLLPKP